MKKDPIDIVIELAVCALLLCWGFTVIYHALGI